MIDHLEKLKKMVLEPRIYALMVKSVRGQILYVGIHFSFDEAYAAARARMNILTPHQPGEAIDVDLWNYMSARECVVQIFDPNKVIPNPLTISADPVNPAIIGIGPVPDHILKAIMAAGGGISSAANDVATQPVLTLQDHVDDVKGAKNELLQKLVDIGDTLQVEKLKMVLTNNERRYILKRIAEKVFKREEMLKESQDQKK